MSQSKPPSPVHPREFNTSLRGMAETQRLPNFPPPSFLGHPERYHGPVGIHPQFHHHDASSQRHGSSSQGFPILPPIRSEGQLIQAVPISKLLADEPSPPRQTGPSSKPPYSPPLTSPPLPSEMNARYQYQAAPATVQATTPGYGPYPYQNPQQSRNSYRTSVSSGKPMPSPIYTSRSPSSASAASAYSPQEPRSSASERLNQMPSQGGMSPGLKYSLDMRQQPVAARACGFGERDRRVVDPPPIVELTLKDKDSLLEGDETPHVYTTLHCTIVHADSLSDASQIEQSRTDMAMTQRLMGTCVASPFAGKDEQGQRGTFFVFPDLSCRSPGRYRFLFRLIVVDPQKLIMGGTSKIQTQIYSDPFEVYSAKEFPGMRASSDLLKTLRKQGLNVAVKKGRDATKKSTKKTQHGDDDSDEDEEMADDDDEEHDVGDSPDRRKRKRA